MLGVTFLEDYMTMYFIIIALLVSMEPPCKRCKCIEKLTSLKYIESWCLGKKYWDVDVFEKLTSGFDISGKSYWEGHDLETIYWDVHIMEENSWRIIIKTLTSWRELWWYWCHEKIFRHQSNRNIIETLTSWKILRHWYYQKILRHWCLEKLSHWQLWKNIEKLTCFMETN